MTEQRVCLHGLNVYMVYIEIQVNIKIFVILLGFWCWLLSAVRR